ncbi:pyrroline-5-carboxylate reductase, partial [Coxiella burnetii]
CGVHTTQDNRQGALNADVVVLAVKPHQIKMVCEELKDILSETKILVISLAVGVTTPLIEKWLGKASRIVRAMPNTPSSVRAGATGLFANETVDKDQKNLAESIMRAVGLVIWVSSEDQIEKIAALSGSGPAYIFLIMEALQEAAEQLGLTKETAELLTEQTVFGAARMALETEQSVVQLRQFVTSPGGTTEQAIKVLESGNLRELFIKALTAAVNRAKELSKTVDQ